MFRGKYQSNLDVKWKGLTQTPNAKICGGGLEYEEKKYNFL